MSNEQQKINWCVVIMSIFLIILVIWTIINQTNDNRLRSDPKLDELLYIIEPLFSNDYNHTGHMSSLNNRDLLSEISLYRGNKSYTINKEKVFLCLKDSNGEYYNTNTLVYVLLHEISHVICNEIGHTELFHEIFTEILDKAHGLGIYNPSILVSTDYCEYGDNSE
jgi:hypothetical protein